MVILRFIYYILITVKYSGVPPSSLQRAIGGPNETNISFFNGLADFHKFDNFGCFFVITLLKIIAATFCFLKVEKMHLNDI